MATKKSTKVNLKPKDATKVQPPSKKGKKADSGSSSGTFFTWFIVLALLGVWTSIAVVYFNLVDYQGLLGKLAAYDKDGDGDFDLEDAKILLGLHQKTADAAFHEEDAADPVATSDPEPSSEDPTELSQEAVAGVASHDEDAAEPEEPSDPEASAEGNSDVVEAEPEPVEDDSEVTEADLLGTDAVPEHPAEDVVEESLVEQEPEDEQEETVQPPEVFEEDPEAVEEEPPVVDTSTEEVPPAGEMPAAELEELAEDIEEPAIDEEVALEDDSEDHVEMDDAVTDTTNDEEEAAEQVFEKTDQGVEEVLYEEHVEDPAPSYDPTEEDALQLEEQASPVEEDQNVLPSEDGFYDSMEEHTEEEEVATIEAEEEEVFPEVEDLADMAQENDADMEPPFYQTVVDDEAIIKAAEEQLAAEDAPLEEMEGRSEE